MHLTKRKWVYLEPPTKFEITTCSCGSEDIVWSEYENHIWCNDCSNEYIPDSWGILDGPIPIEAAKLLGMNFSKLDLENNIVYVLDSFNNYVELCDISNILKQEIISCNLRSGFNGESTSGVVKILDFKSLTLELLIGSDSLENCDPVICSFAIKSGREVKLFSLTFVIEQVNFVPRKDNEFISLSNFLFNNYLTNSLNTKIVEENGIISKI